MRPANCLATGGVCNNLRKIMFRNPGSTKIESIRYTYFAQLLIFFQQDWSHQRSYSYRIESSPPHPGKILTTRLIERCFARTKKLTCVPSCCLYFWIPCHRCRNGEDLRKDLYRVVQQKLLWLSVWRKGWLIEMLGIKITSLRNRSLICKDCGNNPIPAMWHLSWMKRL